MGWLFKRKGLMCKFHLTTKLIYNLPNLKSTRVHLGRWSFANAHPSLLQTNRKFKFTDRRRFSDGDCGQIHSLYLFHSPLLMAALRRIAGKSSIISTSLLPPALFVCCRGIATKLFVGGILFIILIVNSLYLIWFLVFFFSFNKFDVTVCRNT